MIVAKVAGAAGGGWSGLFLLSPEDRDVLTDMAIPAGWQVVGARRLEDAERRYLAGEALVALVDARVDGVARIGLLGQAVEASGGALVALAMSQDDAAALFAAGATHVLDAPLTAARLALTLESARIMVQRLGGGPQAANEGEDDAPPPGRLARNSRGRDFLTGLSNRQTALNWTSGQLENGAPILMLLGIGQFDRVNAAYGQVAGDALLGRIARRVERLVDMIVGTGALTARVAGTEYLVGLPAISDSGSNPAAPDRAIFLARRLIAAIGQPFSAGDHLIRLIGRCGIAQALPGDDAARLLRRAGTALADARNSDGEGIRILAADARSRKADPDRLESDLRLALDRKEIGLVFQPQYDCHRPDEIVGVEALARWNHPHYGALGAGALFAAAERSDFLLPLSAHIQAEALRQAVGWPDTLADLRLSVNVTASDISQPDFIENFLKLVDDSGFPRARLTVEITESGLIENIDAAAALLVDLRRAGLRVAIDDFGTGYSSLAYLKALPLDYLKIDSGLAQDIAGSARDRIVVRGVIHMAKSLGLKVIAEGVETAEQRDLLTREGCDFYQGFLKAPGVASEDLPGLLG